MNEWRSNLFLSQENPLKKFAWKLEWNFLGKQTTSKREENEEHKNSCYNLSTYSGRIFWKLISKRGYLDRFAPTLGSIQKQGNLKLLANIISPGFPNSFKMIQNNQHFENGVDSNSFNHKLSCLPWPLSKSNVLIFINQVVRRGLENELGDI